MPIYEYECEQHGCFEAERPMSSSREPAECPSCQHVARRVLSVPNLFSLEASQRKALGINERSQHEPRLVQREERPASAAPAWGASSGRPWALGH